MNLGPVVSNASSLISFELIGRLDLLREVIGQVVIPPEVRREVGSGLAQLPWISERVLLRPLDVRVAAATLGPGESEAIGLAVELDAVRVILDDKPARRLAMALGLSVIGTVGVVLSARESGLIAEVAPIVEALVATGFRMDQSLRDLMISNADDP